MSGAQVGKTEVLLNILGFYIAHDPSPILVLQPTLQMAQAFSKDRVATMLRDTPCLKNKVKDPRSRDSGNTTLHKSFPGGHVTIAGSNSPSSLASRPIRVVFADEVDRYPPSAGAEGDPVQLARKRSATFHNRKLVLTSTPTIRGASRIETAYDASDRRRYLVPCGDCGEAHALEWANVRWPEGEPQKAVYVCEQCGSAWDDATRIRAIAKGRWKATAPFTGVAGFHLNGLYSPWTRLGDAAAEFLDAKRLPETLRVFVNTFLGETWEDQGEQIDDTFLSDRREDWGDELPREIVLLTCGVDVQDDRFEMEVVGWGRDEESWSVDYQTIYGDPSAPEIWSELDQFLTQTYRHSAGIDIPIRATCIDSGGHYTQAVYNFVRPREGRRIVAIKGVGGEGKALVGRPSRNNIGKIKLFPVGTDTAKELIYGRLKIEDPGAGYCHLPVDRDDEYFRQLVGEKIVTKYVQGRARRAWLKTRPRVEALDCRVYATAAFAFLNTNINQVATRFARGLRPKAKPEPEAEATVLQRPVRRRPGNGFVNSWRG